MSREEVYDTKINPLMTEIIAICREHNIPIVASFGIGTDDDPDLLCSTAIVLKDGPVALRNAAKCISSTTAPMMLTVHDQNGNITQAITIRRDRCR